VSVSPQKQAASEALAGLAPFAGGVRVAEKLVLLTRDESLTDALASVVAAESLLVVTDEAVLATHLLSGLAGVVFIDAAMDQVHPGATALLTQRLHVELPDIVLVVAGDGTAQTELAALVGDGTIYRFVHKPVSAQRVKLFVDAAWRKREDRNAISGILPALSMSQPEQLALPPRESPWLPATVGAAVIAAGAAWYHMHKGPPAHAVSSAPALTQVVPQPVPLHPVAPAPTPSAPVARATARMRTPARAPTITAPSITPVPVPVPLPVPVLAPIVAASPATAISATLVPAPDVPGPPTSTPPISEARDPLSVAAVILHRVYAVDPEFPEVARDNDLAGYVDLEFTVHPDGSVTDVTVLKAQPTGVFEKSAVAAVAQWRYEPIERDGVPVTEHARLRLNFGYK
jgi:protein TonB